MMFTVCAVRDLAVGIFLQPFTVRSSGEAVRSFVDTVNDGSKGNLMNSHPEDYELYELGLYDDSAARYVLHADPVRLARGLDHRVSA